MNPTTTEAPSEVRALTVPDIAKALDYPLDKLREKIRRTAALQKLLLKVGPTRILPAASLDAFRVALTACSNPSADSSTPSTERSPVCAAT